MAPTQTLEPGEVAVCGDPLATGFDGEGRQVGVGDEVSPGAGIKAQPFEEAPVPRSGVDHEGVWRSPKGVDERQRDRHGTGDFEDSRMGHDTDEPAQDDRREAEWFVRPDGGGEPVAISLVVRRVRPRGVDEDIDVDEDQRSVPSMTSSNAAMSSSSTPGRSPP